jgi:hypothetical protein
MSKHRSSLKGKRLVKVLNVLEAAGAGGASTYEIQLRARVTDVKDIIYELKHNGIEIVDEWENRHKRYFLACEVA